MFDKVNIIIRSGNGGNGALSFRREKFIPLGGPDGGDGGDGGSVILKSVPSTSNLLALRQRKIYSAGNGSDGSKQKKRGRKGIDLILEVPLGTVIRNKGQIGDEPEIIVDLEEPGQEFVTARGGRGGKGNVHFATSTNQSPKIAQKGEPGQQIDIILELKTIADVGVIGYPNAGKSSLLAAASAAKPKIASYPFTTLKPVLGVVELGRYSFILAEVPGLIKDAHLGRGLGHDFLRHISRTKVLIHVIDGSSPSPVEDFKNVNMELNLFDSALVSKRQVVVVNKIDLPEVREKMDAVKKAFSDIGYRVFFISAATSKGVASLMSHTFGVLGQTSVKKDEVIPEKVFRPKPKDTGIKVTKEEGSFLVQESDLERIVAAADTDDAEVKRQLLGYLARRGVDKALKKAGAKPGDIIRIDRLKWQL
jgi:GTP-binding protein